MVERDCILVYKENFIFFADFISRDSKIVETDRGCFYLIFSLGTGSQERNFRGEQYMCMCGICN
jgi:hypothetical protein